MIAVEHHADFAPGKAQSMAGKRGDVAAVNHYAPGIRPDEHVDASQKRAFSGAGAADDSEHLAPHNVQRDIPKRRRLGARELID